jgi:hypothetical protein
MRRVVSHAVATEDDLVLVHTELERVCAGRDARDLRQRARRDDRLELREPRRPSASP